MRHLRLVNDRPEWEERANCSTTDPEVFYPEAGSNGTQAKRICGRCEVKTECLEYALDRDERYGVWGGKNETERKKMRRQRRAGQTLEVAA